ncbi:MAG: helix-turn-helix domain-containing protein [Arcticibacter sp.]
MKPLNSALLSEYVSCQAAIFSLGRYLENQHLTIYDLGDHIPGSVMLQDLGTMTNLYMNKRGCDILKHTNDELKEMGSAYFLNFFPNEELNDLRPRLEEFINQNDHTASYSFFQRVRSNPTADFRWYLTHSLFSPGTGINGALQLIHIAVDVEKIEYAGQQLNYLLEQNSFVKRNFCRYITLTSREKEIIRLIANDKSSYEIACKLFISLNTVNNHRKNILNKLESKSFSQLIRFAIAFNII